MQLSALSGEYKSPFKFVANRERPICRGVFSNLQKPCNGGLMSVPYDALLCSLGGSWYSCQSLQKTRIRAPTVTF